MTPAKGYRFEFKLLLASLGVCNAAFPPQLKELLCVKVYEQIRRSAIELRRLGAVITILNERGKKVVKFAGWTEGWMAKSWDGSPRSPSWRQLFFSPHFRESRRWLRMKFPVAIDEETESQLKPEILAVKRMKVLGATQHGSKNTKSDSPSLIYEGSLKLNKIMLGTFKQLSNSIGTTLGPKYKVDESQLPQYEDVHLTPNDPHHP